MDINKDTVPSQTEKSRYSINWKDSHVVFFFLPITLTILFPGGGIFYLCGRFHPSILLYVYLLYLVVLVFIFYCLFLGVVKLSGRRGKRTRNERLLIAAETIVPLIFIGLIVVSFFFAFTDTEFCGRRFKFFMLGFRDRVKSKANIESMRAWLQTLNDEDYKSIDNSYNSYPRNRSEWPKPSRVLEPGKVFLSADENGNAKIRLVWGSSPIEGHWGVEIGAENMEIPPSDLNMYGEYRLPVEPGLYVWRSLE